MKIVLYKIVQKCCNSIKFAVLSLLILIYLFFSQNIVYKVGLVIDSLIKNIILVNE